MSPSIRLDPLQNALLDRYQRGMPIVGRPYHAMGRALGVGEDAVLGCLRTLTERGVVSRVGPVFRPRTVGYSTLAAMAVPPEDLDRVAERVNRYEAVNHNYERGHRLNLWFVVTGGSQVGVTDVLNDIERETGLRVLDLPLVTAYHIDLGFSLRGESDCNRAEAPSVATQAAAPLRFSAEENALIALLQQGLALIPRPYRPVSRCAGLSESEVCRRLRSWQTRGLLSRFGVVVRHHELGYRANGMVVWNIPDDQVDRTGRAFARYPFVTLCYRRPRRGADWPYNLFCMIHGRDTATVEAQARILRHSQNLPEDASKLLFSLRRFKQRGARYRSPALGMTMAPVHG